MRKHKTILVADDYPPIRRLVERMLALAGYQVICAANGEEALELVRTRCPDALITDIDMPRLDGRALCRMTDVLKATRPFLTLVLTGWSADREEAWIEGMRDTRFVQKPFSPRLLVQTLDTYFGFITP